MAAFLASIQREVTIIQAATKQGEDAISGPTENPVREGIYAEAMYQYRYSTTGARCWEGRNREEQFRFDHRVSRKGLPAVPRTTHQTPLPFNIPPTRRRDIHLLSERGSQ